jgi:hypothetical protein
VSFGGKTYNLSQFGIQVDANFNFNYAITNNALANATVDLAGAAFPNADISSGTLGASAGLSQFDETCTIAANPAVQSQFVSNHGSSSPAACGQQSFSGNAQININSGLSDPSVLLGALLGTHPEVFSLHFEISAAADASGNVFNSAFPNVTTGCDSSTDPNCVLAISGSNTAIASSTDPDITSINIVDANGQIVPFFTFQTLDGFSLPSGEPTAPSPVPEPGSVWLLGVGLAGLLAAQMRRSKARVTRRRM